MNPPSLRKKPKSQQWPYVTWSPDEKKWKVDARTKNGGSRRFFATKLEAETYAQQCRVQKENEGISAFGNLELAKYGKTVQNAVEFYLAHLRETEATITVEQALKELITLRKNAGRNSEYLRGLRIRLGRFMKDHPGKLLIDFDTGRLNLWLASLSHAPATKNTFRRDLVTLFSFAHDHGYCSTNPAEKTEVASDFDKPVGILTPEEAAALLNACDADLAPYVAIGLFAGLRAAELSKLNWTEIDLDSGHIEVTAAKSKTRRRRLIPISDNLKKWLCLKPVISGMVAVPGLRKRFESLRKKAGFQEWPKNALRHSFGSYRLAQCHDVARVSLEMGNSPAIVFAHYRELVKPKDAERFWQIVPNSSTP